MARRLTRAKQTLRGSEKELHETPETIDLAARLKSVLKVIYLMFAMGYAPRRGEYAVRSDIALEALRLARLLAGHAPTATAEAAALCALLCFQASRLAARETAQGGIILLEFQDRGLWDRNLIAEGLGHLQTVRQAPVVSRYHLEAGIAATHALAPNWESCDWSAIVRLYGHLETMTRSPVVAVNAGVALAMAGDPDAAMKKLEAVSDLASMHTYAPYFLARAEVLARQGKDGAARESWQRALTCPMSEPVAAVIRERLSSLTG